jgi:hypothetical protein
VVGMCRGMPWKKKRQRKERWDTRYVGHE